MKINSKNFIEKYKYAIFIFLFIFVYNFIFVKGFAFPGVDRLTYHYYLVDFSLGFCTKLLPGAVFNAIASSTEPEVLNIYLGVIYHVFLVAVSVMLGKFISIFEDKNKLIAFVIVMFAITGPATFSIHIFRFGMLDTNWLYLVIALIVFMRNKILRWFIPVLFVLTLMIHISSMVLFIPMFALMVLMEAGREKSSRKIYLTIFSISVAVSVAFFVYMLINENDNLVLSYEEYMKLMTERYKLEGSMFTEFFDYALYKISYVDGASDMFSAVLIEGDGFIANAVNAVWAQIYETLRAYVFLGDYMLVGVNDFIVSSPIVVLLYKYAIKQLKKDSSCNKLQKFVWVCLIFMLPVMFMAALSGSPDIVRWFGHCFLLLFTFVLYDIYRRKDENPVTFNVEINNRTTVGTIIYFAVYMCCVLDPYC